MNFSYIYYNFYKVKEIMLRLLNQSSILLLALVTTMGLTISNAWSSTPNLPANIWTITGNDDAGNIWDGSTITFEEQSAIVDGFHVAGYFNWADNHGHFGRENFSGTLFSSNHLTVSGYEIVSPASGLGLGIYDADVTIDGTHMINGTWIGPGTPSHNWSAVQSPVPEPSIYVLLLAGLVIVGLQMKNRKWA